MSKLLAGLAFLLFADPSPQDSPPLPGHNTAVDDPDFWKDKDFLSPDEDRKAFPQPQSPDNSSSDTLPPDGDRAWRRKDYLTAASDYQKQAALSSDAPEAWYNAALSYYRQEGWRAETLNALSRAEAHATGPLRSRCLLMRADIEYRDALPKEPFARLAGLGRALQMYRDVVAGSDTDPGMAQLAKYDIEVVKLRLLLHWRAGGAPPPGGDADTEPSAEDIAAENSAPKQPRKPQEKASQPKDW